MKYAMLGAFCMGVVVCILTLQLLFVGLQSPFSINAREIASPKDRIDEQSIHVFSDYIIIEMKDALYAKYANTNSMDPFLDQGHNGIELKPQSESDIVVGDIISYKSKLTATVQVHRVVDIKNDGKIYFVVKGDNNPTVDMEKVRFEQIQGVLVGILY